VDQRATRTTALHVGLAMGPMLLWLLLAPLVPSLAGRTLDGAFVLATFAVLTLGVLAITRLTLSSPAPSGSPVMTLRGCLALSAWFGLISGLGETWYLAGRVGFLGRVPADNWTFGPESIWLAPLTSIAVFALFGGLLWAGGRAIRRPVTVRVLSAIAVAAVLWTWIGQTGRLHEAATGIFAFAVSYRIAISRRPSPTARRWLNWSAAGGALLIAAMIAYTVLDSALRERRATNVLPEAPDAPNVLLVVLDTQRAASMSVHGGTPGTTPGLERWAEQGLVFDHALSSSSWTLPSHATMFTGRHNTELGTDPYTPLGHEHLTLAEFFAGQGYRTGGFVANLFYASEFFGLARGFHRYRDHPGSVGMILVSSFWPRRVVRGIRTLRGVPKDFPEKAAPVVSRQFLDWLGEDENRPFFAFLNYFDAHAPYDAPSEYLSDPEAPSLPWYRRGLLASRYSPAELSAMENAYDGAVRFVDHEVDLVLQELDRRGLLERTIVVITSDHGETFGEHGRVGHGHTLYPEETHVPLVIRLPESLDRELSGPRNSHIAAPVGLRDLPATLLDLLDLPSEFPGRSFLTEQRPDTLLTEIDTGWFGLTGGGFRYLVRPDGSEELYDFAADPGHTQDLIDDPLYAETLTRFRSALRARTGATIPVG